MGYHITQLETRFYISAENADLALAALKNLQEQDLTKGSARCSHYKGATTRSFSWVVSSVVMRAAWLEDALAEWRWDAHSDDEGNLIGMSFTGEKLGDDEQLFDAIAPFVSAGSYIRMLGEDGANWTWEFDGKTCISVQR